MNEQDSGSATRQEGSNMTIKNSISDKARRGKDKVSQMSSKARAKYEKAQSKTSESVASAREKGSAYYAQGKAKASAGYERSRQQVENTPLAILAGGLALGALVAAVIPESQREKRAMGSASRKINGRAKEAMSAAKARGTEKVDELGLSTDALKKQMEDFVTKGVEILKSAGKAAGDAAKKG